MTATATVRRETPAAEIARAPWSPLAATAMPAGTVAANTTHAPASRVRGHRYVRVLRLAYLRLCRRLGGLRACAPYRGV